MAGFGSAGDGTLQCRTAGRNRREASLYTRQGINKPWIGIVGKEIAELFQSKKRKGVALTRDLFGGAGVRTTTQVSFTFLLQDVLQLFQEFRLLIIAWFILYTDLFYIFALYGSYWSSSETTSDFHGGFPSYTTGGARDWIQVLLHCF